MSEFGVLDLDEVAGEVARLTNKGDGSGNFLDQFVPMPDVKAGQTGSVTVRILPPVKGGKLFQYNRTHKLNGRSIHCPVPLVKGTNGKLFFDKKAAKCPICEYYSSLWKQIEKLERQYGKDCPQADPLKQEARDIKPTERYYYNAVVRSLIIDNKELKNVGPRILSVGKGLHGVFLEAINGREGDPESKLGNITDLKAGWDFVIRKEVTLGGDGFPKYEKSGFARNPSIAGAPEEIAQWASNLHDLTKLRNPKDEEYLGKQLAIHRGLIPDEAEGMNIDDFDKQWGGGKEKQEQVQELLNHTPGGVSVPADIVAEAPAPQPTVHVEDEDFMKELEDM